MTDKEQIMNNFEKDINVLTKAKLIEQLISKTQECEELKIKLMQKDEVNTFFNTPIEGWSSNPCDICESKNNYEQLKQECEVLKSESFTREELITLQEKDINRYRKALEEIEAVCLEDTRTFADGTQLRYNSLDKILDIISKAKGE